MAARAQCSSHLEIALAVLEVRQRDQAQSPAPIVLFAGQTVKVVGLKLINDVPRLHFRNLLPEPRLLRLRLLTLVLYASGLVLKLVLSLQPKGVACCIAVGADEPSSVVVYGAATV